MNASTPTRDFDAVVAFGREAYLASPVCKARKAIAKAARLNTALGYALDRMSCALTRGDGTEAAQKALFDAMLDLRIAVGDVETLARMAEAAS